ncbi:photosystem reaction center subunit H [Zhengella mangrovi]|uniref:Photosystem reaction center subunit H n=1 Tax=Zhengella mangrovi TaxID=1982044 RepID=A0A2G1QUS1_9HYPH|nr:PRC-barrel domain-containing protein [Zhengella mangrovi]PHP68948.1 photosystem reaction center subunit H [Zhengella mangrovi]
MLSKLFATTAMVAVLTSGALAADQSMNKDMTNNGQPVFSTEAGKDMTSESGYFEANANQILASRLLGATVYTEKGEAKAGDMAKADQPADAAKSADKTAANQQNTETTAKDDRVAKEDTTAAGGKATAENATTGNAAASDQAQNGMMDRMASVGDVNDVVMGKDGQAEAVVIGVGGFLGIGEKNVAVDFDKLSWVERDGEKWLMIDATRQDLENAPAFDVASVTGDQSNEQAADASAEQKAMTKDQTAMSQPKADGQNTAVPAEQQQAAAKDQPAAAAKDQQAMDNQAVDKETTAAVSHEGWQATAEGKLSAEELLGTRVYGANDEDIGEIGDVIVTADGKLDAYVVDVGGFLGIGEKPVALDASELQIMKNQDGDLRIFTAYTQDQLENQTAYDANAYANNRDEMLLR